MYDYLLHKVGGYLETAVCAIDESIFAAVGMSPYHNDDALGKSCDNSGKSRSLYAHFGHAKVSEDKHPVKHKVHEHGGKTCKHGNKRLIGLSQRGGVYLCYRKWDKTYYHYTQVVKSRLQYQRLVAFLAVSRKIRAYKFGAEQ